jgi:hypothetical protein
MSSIGRVFVRTGSRPAIVSQRFEPKVELSVADIEGISTVGVQEGYTLIYNSSTGNFESKAIADLTGEITEIFGGTF